MFKSGFPNHTFQICSSHSGAQYVFADFLCVFMKLTQKGVYHLVKFSKDSGSEKNCWIVSC